jgi:hypothetical protein
MSGITSVSRFFALSVALVLLGPGAAPAAEDPPDFSGVWVFNEKRSDDLRTKIEEAVGPDATRGDVKKDIVRVWIRRWLLSVIEDPDSRYLTIEQSPESFKSGLGDEVSAYYFGRVASSQGPLGGTLRVKVHWQGSELVTEEGSSDGGRIVAVYTILPPGDTLLVRYRLEHKTLIKPLEVSMFFDRDEDVDP